MLLGHSKRFSDAAINFFLLVLQTNKGIGRALMAGLSVCGKDYIVRVDNDCISQLVILKRLLVIITMNSEVGFLVHRWKNFLESPNDLGRFGNVLLEHDQIVRFCARWNPMNHVTGC